MQTHFLFILFVCITLSVTAQVNVRVKNSGNTNELDIKTGKKPSTTKNGESTSSGIDSKKPADSKSTPITKDTSLVPSSPTGGDEQYNGPARVHVKAFWDIVRKLKEGKGGSATGLQSQLKLIKEKDPSYNVSAMEEEWKIWKDKAEQTKMQKDKEQEEQVNKIKASNEERVAKTKYENLLQEVIDGTVMQVGQNNLPQVDQAMANFKTKTEEVLKLDLPKYKVKLDDLKRYVDKSHTLAADRVIASAKTLLQEFRQVEEFEPVLKELQFRQLYWDFVRKVYPGDAVCEKYYKEISDLLKQTGSIEDIKKTAGKNATAAIKNRKLPEALAHDPALEKALIDGFNSKYKSTYNGTAIKVIILQPEWYIEKNKLTGVVTGRNKHCALVYKGADGKCYLMSQLVYAYQDYVGGTFGKTQIVYNGLGGEEMLCENVK